jgi:hypothetical protein
MTFSVQNDNGTNLAANAYISVATFKSYHDDRGNDYSAFADDTAIEKALVQASDYIDARFTYIGAKITQDEPTEWPRVNAIDPTGYLITGLPPAVKEACAEYALRVLDGSLFPDPQRDASGYIIESTSKTVGPISKSVTYAQGGGVYNMPQYSLADNKLKKAGLVELNNSTRRA